MIVCLKQVLYPKFTILTRMVSSKPTFTAKIGSELRGQPFLELFYSVSEYG